MRSDSIQRISVSPVLREAVLLLCTAAALTIVPFSQALAEAPDSEWRRCAGEGEVCRFSGTARVGYGADGKYFYKTMQGPVNCTNAVFGDPIPYTGKSCHVLLATGLTAPNPTFTEPVGRVGNFAVTVETPSCDSWYDTLSKYGGRALNAATILNPYRHVYEFIKAEGDPERYVENIKNEFDEVKTFAGDATAFVLAENPVGALATMHYLSKLLPDGEVKNFMGRGRQTIANLSRSVVVSSLDTVESDFLEIAGDAWNIVKNVDDPEQFFTQFGNGYQKWSPTGALTLIFTSDDPALGAQLAAARLKRQADIASTYFVKAGSAKKILSQAVKLKQLQRAGRLRNARAIGVANSLGRGDLTRLKAKDVVKKLIKDELEQRALEEGKRLLHSAQPGDRKALAFLLGEMARAAGANDKPLGYHQLYRDTQVTNVPAKWMGNDHGSRATHNMSGYHPIVENGSDCINLGDNITQRGDKKTLKALCGKPGTRAVANGKDKWWARPVDFIPIYNDSCSGASHDRSIWLPRCPTGFLPVGVALAGEGSQKPLPNRIACLKDDPTIIQVTDGVTAGLVWETDDRNSGAKLDVTIYNREFLGMQLSWAVSGYHGNDRAYLQGIEIPISRRHPTIVQREERIAEALARAKREAESNIQAGGGQNTVTPQWNVGDQVEVLRPADGRWTAASVLALDARNGVFIQYQDTSQRMWVAANSVRASQGGGGQGTVTSRWSVGDQVDVLDGDGMWGAAIVLALDPVDGVLIRYEDTYQQMWVGEHDVRAGQSGGGQSTVTSQWNVGDQVEVLRPADGRWTAASVLALDPVDGVLIRYEDTYQQMWVGENDVRAGQSGGGEWGGQEPQAGDGCELRGQIVSVNSQQSATVTIVNDGSTYIYVYWIDYGGNEGDYQSRQQPLLTIAPGGAQSVASAIGFGYTVVGENGNCLGVVQASEAVNEFVFAGF